MKEINYKKMYPDVKVKKLAKKDLSYINRVLNNYLAHQEELSDKDVKKNFSKDLDYFLEKERTDKNILKILEASRRKEGSYVRRPLETPEEKYERLKREKKIA